MKAKVNKDEIRKEKAELKKANQALNDLIRRAKVKGALVN